MNTFLQAGCSDFVAMLWCRLRMSAWPAQRAARYDSGLVCRTRQHSVHILLSLIPICDVAVAWAGSLAVEVCCGALQHPQGVRAPAAQHHAAASSATGHQDAVLPLGPVPHMIRYTASSLLWHYHA